jgi:curved DNA-binding protein CbpA
MVPDPYKALDLPHSATSDDIKRSYRKLAMKLHPDRLASRGASEKEIKESTANFARVTAAYSILSDPARKEQYDHIYKYGGYDNATGSSGTASQQSGKSSSPQTPPKPQKGIGYTFIDPVAYVLSQGKVKSQAVAGVSIPSRFSRPGPGGGFRVCISSGKAKESETGSLHCRSTTMLFSGGKKFNKVETTTIHRDGRKETLIEGDDYVERRVSAAKPRRPATDSRREDGENLAPTREDIPWHQQVLKGITSNIQKCTNPTLCDAIRVQ